MGFTSTRMQEENGREEKRYVAADPGFVFVFGRLSRRENELGVFRFFEEVLRSPCGYILRRGNLHLEKGN